MEAVDLARKAVELCSDRQGSDILMLDLRGVSGFADYFVLCSAETHRHLENLMQELDKALSQGGAQPLHCEGTPESGWLLLDYGSVVIHLFTPEERAYYNLEELWKRATPVLRLI